MSLESTLKCRTTALVDLSVLFLVYSVVKISISPSVDRLSTMGFKLWVINYGLSTMGCQLSVVSYGRCQKQNILRYPLLFLGLNVGKLRVFSKQISSDIKQMQTLKTVFFSVNRTIGLLVTDDLALSSFVFANHPSSHISSDSVAVSDPCRLVVDISPSHLKHSPPLSLEPQQYRGQGRCL